MNEKNNENVTLKNAPHPHFYFHDRETQIIALNF